MDTTRRLPALLSAVVWALPITVIALLIAVARASGALGSDLLVFNLVWVIGSSGGVGALLATRKPRNAVGWLIWFSGCSLGLTLAASYYVQVSTTFHGGSLPGTMAAGCYSAWSGSLGLMAAFGLVPLIFPNGHPLPGAWRWILVLSVFGCVGSVLADVTRAGPLMDGYAPLNPLGIETGPVPLVAGFVQTLGAPVLALAALMSVVVRYRRGDVVERQQLRWFAAAVAVASMGLLILLFAPEQLAELGFGILVFSLGLVPVAIGIAVLRYRLYEIDRIISRTVAWLLLTLTLAAVFGGLIVGFQAMLAPITEGNTLAVAASTLVAFALFQPLRRRTQTTVDRRFNRARYDGEQVVSTFGERLRGEADLAGVEADIAATVRAALHPGSVTVWVRTEAGG